MALQAPNAQELEKIQKLREQLVDISSWQDTQDDGFLLRWLKSFKDMDIEKTKAGLLAAYKWRQENKIDTLMTDAYKPDPELVKLFPYDIVGVDKDNCPVVVSEVQKHNPKKIIDKYGKEALIVFSDYNGEKLMSEMRKRSTKEKPVQQITAILDAKKFTFKQLTSPGAVELGLESVRRAEEYYPGILKLLVVVNAPKVAKLAYKIVKPFVRENTIKNVKIYPKVNSKVQKFLLQHIDADQLPIKYGGTLKVGDTTEKVADDDEDISGNPEDLDETDMVETKVAAGKKLKLEYNVEQPGTQICWSFQTDDREIGFTVYIGEKEETIVPYQKFESLNLQTSSINCDKVGKYTLCFNNKENRFRSCTLSYMVNVFPPGSADDED